MSKILSFAFASFFLTFQIQAHVVEATDSAQIDQPYQESRLHELTGGQELRSEAAKKLTLLHRAASDSPSSLRFSEETERPCQDINCGLTLKKSDFVVTKKSAAGCGSVKYEAHDKQSPERVVEVTDHSERICDDLQPYQWELILKEPGKAARYLVAEPDEISDLQ